MEGDFPWHVRDYRLETRFPEHSNRVVVHEHDDLDSPPSSPPCLERWESGRRPLGSGGQGQVFVQKCYSGCRIHTLRAVKVIPLGQGGISKTQRYRQELETNFRFSHPKYSRHFVKSLGWYMSYDSTCLCIAMEFLPRGDLQTYLDNYPPLMEAECRDIVGQVVKALQVLHKEGFAHRDIKPRNVLIQQCPTDNPTPNWWVKLADFGISKQLEADTTENSIICGTNRYWAPELLLRLLGNEAQGSLSAIDHPAADMWALGVMAFRVLTGVDPFPNTWDVLRYRDNPDGFPQAPLTARPVSSQGVSFTRALLEPSALKRLASSQAISHDWINHYRSSVSEIPATPQSLSAMSSVASSTPDDERGLTTQLSNLVLSQSRIHADSSSNTAVPPTTTLAQRAAHTPPDHSGDSDVSQTAQSSLTTPLTKYTCPLANCPQAQSATGADFDGLVTHLMEDHVRREDYPHPETLGILSVSECVLLWAAHRGKEAIVSVLVGTGIDLGIRDHHRCTPLHVAAWSGKETIVEVLLEKGADIESRDQHDETPLTLAAWRGHEAVVRLLLENGADTESQNQHNNTPLASAAYAGHEAIVKLLLDKGANIESQNQANGTPLLLAVWAGREAIVRLLLGKGADIESRGERGRTVIFFAVERGHKGVIRVLLRYGADVESQDVRHQTPLSLAEQLHHDDEELLKLLEEAAKQQRHRKRRKKCVK